MGRWHGIILFLRMCVDTNRQSLDISIMGFRSIDLLLVMLQRFIVLISAWIRVTIAAHLCIINWWDWLRPWWFAPSVGFPFIKQLRLRTLESRLPTPSVRSSEFMHKPLAALTSKWVYASTIVAVVLYVLEWDIAVLCRNLNATYHQGPVSIKECLSGYMDCVFITDIRRSWDHVFFII